MRARAKENADLKEKLSTGSSFASSLNTTQLLTLISIAVGIAGIYYKREELKLVWQKVKKPQQHKLQLQKEYVLKMKTIEIPPPKRRGLHKMD